MNDTATTTTLPRWLVGLCLLISLVGIADHDLWTPDEPREAAIMLRMSRTGDLLIPNLAGEPFVEKPPLYYIVGAGALRLLGEVLGPTAALRLTSALWGLGTLFVTWLLARRLLGRERALFAVLLLATLPGFIHVTHWLLVDNALLFFVTAALWCFAEAYLGLRLKFLPWAAVFTGAAFLAKGFIGPLIILPGFLALLFSWTRQAGVLNLTRPGSLLWHGLALGLGLILMLSWPLALRAVGGPDLWHEWFWVNQFGRFSGEARQLGHMQGVWYYLKVIPVYLLPWLVIILLGAKNLLSALARRQMTPTERLLTAWALGGLLLLSLPATKREIYLSVLLPAFAMIGASTLQAPLKRAMQNAAWVWIGCMLSALLFFILAPLLGPQVRLLTGGWGRYQVIAALTALGCVFLVNSSRGSYAIAECNVFWFFRDSSRFRFLHSAFCILPFFQRVLAATAIFYVGGLTILFPMLDKVPTDLSAIVPTSQRVGTTADGEFPAVPGQTAFSGSTGGGSASGGKSYGSAFREMAKEVADGPADRVAGWQLDETMRAGFYYYCNLVFQPLSDINELNSVLARRHPRFDSVLTLARNFPPRADPSVEGPPEAAALPPWRQRHEVRMGPRRILRWIEGVVVAKPSD